MLYSFFNTFHYHLKIQKLISFIEILIDADEEKKKDELRLVAKKELEEWYKIHKEQIAKTKDVNR